MVGSQSAMYSKMWVLVSLLSLGFGAFDQDNRVMVDLWTGAPLMNDVQVGIQVASQTSRTRLRHFQKFKERSSPLFLWWRWRWLVGWVGRDSAWLMVEVDVEVLGKPPPPPLGRRCRRHHHRAFHPRRSFGPRSFCGWTNRVLSWRRHLCHGRLRAWILRR